jgi:hypothetical protein
MIGIDTVERDVRAYRSALIKKCEDCAEVAKRPLLAVFL